jgi:hypothetical protein
MLLALIGAVDDIRGLGPVSRLLVQAVAVGVVIATLPSDFRIVPLLPRALEWVLLLVGGVWFVNLVNFMDGIDWMTGRRNRPDHRRRGAARPARRGAAVRRSGRARAARRNRRLCAVQPARSRGYFSVTSAACRSG